MDTTAEQRFYDEHVGKLPPEVLDFPAAEKSMRTVGDRYFCILDSLPNPKDLTAIEWGFGSVSRLVVLQRLFRSYTAVDISARLLLRSHQIEADIREYNLNADLDIPSESYDVAIAMMIIEHLFDPFHSFRELARITKTGGLAFVNLPLVTGLRNRARLLAGKLPVTSVADWWKVREWDGGHLHYFNIEAVRNLGRMCGLHLEKMYPVGAHARLKRFAPALLCSEMSFVFRKTANPA